MRTIAITLGVLFMPHCVVAADFHLTPEGAGKRDGSSWDDAFAQADLTAAVNDKLQPGDRLFVAGGTYRNVSLTIDKGGVAGKLKSIVGVDRGDGLPTFVGQWSVDEPTKGATAIRLGPGASYLDVQNLRLRGYATGVQASDVAKGNEGRGYLAFRDVDIEQFRYGFYLSDCDELSLVGCDLKRYTKHGFRLEAGCDRVTLRTCTADCSEGDADWEQKTELLPFGFIVNNGGAPNTQVRFEDCLARNNLMPLQKNRYKNGDGFVVEGNTTGASFVGCRAIRNQDGGFDLKPRDVRLTDCLAIGNSRGFRIWATGTLTNCFAGWGSTGLWCNGGPVAVTRCTFHEVKAAVLTDDRATEPVTLKDCLISAADTPHRKTAHGPVVLETTIIAERGVAETDPQFVRPDVGPVGRTSGPSPMDEPEVRPTWNGQGDAMNSRRFADKGYLADPTAKTK
jgi:hypothetical protein